MDQNRHNPCGAVPFSLITVANGIAGMQDPPVLVSISYLGDDGLRVVGVIVALYGGGASGT